MALPPEVMKELMATFRVDVDDQLQAISDSLLGVEKENDADQRHDLLHSAMRAAHNIKGAARGIGVADVGAVAHSLENLLTKVMKGDADMTPAVGDLCFEAVDGIKSALQAFTDETDLPFDIGDLTGRLDSGVAPGDATGKKPAPQQSEARAPTSIPEPKPEPDLEPAREPEPGSAPTSLPKSDAKPAPEATPSEAEEEAPVVVKAAAAAAKSGEVLRISTDKLDRLESLVEEMYASKIDLDDFIDELRGVQSVLPTIGAENDGGIAQAQIRDVSQDLERIYKFMRSRGRSLGVVLSSIRYEMRTLRLVPAAGLTRPLARSVRDIARQMNKQVDFVTRGEETEMDRAVMDMLSDPMVHLLRNAIDHGIESPQDRKAAGKDESGTIQVVFRLEGGQVKIRLSDDGRGIDPDKVADSAVGKNVISAKDAAGMTRAQKLDLIFHPGFSTKSIITDVSGRGVGMDIVRANIQALHGDISVSTEVGKGSTFTLSVPLTLATERGLVVRVGDQVFAIPVGNVERVVDVKPSDLTDVEGSKALLVDGLAVAMRRLSAVLGVADDADTSTASRPVVIVAVGWRRIGMVVDEVMGQREMVVRPLSAPLVNVRNIAGGTLIGGRVRMVLNPEGLVASALRAGSGVGFGDFDETTQAAKTILAVDDSLTTRTLVRNVLETAGFAVTTAVNGKEAWDILSKETFDLVVTDVEMPVMNGFELTRTIKESDNLADMPVIIVTSLATEEDKEMGVEVGADAYIVKGDFETRILLDVVEQLI